MTDNHPDCIPIEIGGRERLLKYRLASFTVAQTRYNVRFTLSMIADPSFADIPILLWIGLLSDHPRLSLERVVRWVEDDRVDVSAFLQKALPKITKLLGLAKDDLTDEEFEGEETLEDQLAPLD